MTWWRRLLRPQALERALDAELRDHLQREIADRVRAGSSSERAERRIVWQRSTTRLRRGA